MKYEKKTNSARICVLSLFDIKAEHPNEMNEKEINSLERCQKAAVKVILKNNYRNKENIHLMFSTL